jgi:small-conductance mechanosensitive channel
MSTSAEFHALLLDLWRDLQNVNVLWQVGALAVCILIGWGLTRRYNRRAHSHAPLDVTQALGIGSMQRLLFPLSTLVLVMTAKTILRHWHSTHLLNVAAALLLAMALIRIAIYVLRHTFAQGAWLRASERWISWLAWIGVAVYLTGLWPFVREALLEIDFTVGKQKFSLLLVLQSTFWIISTLLIAMWLGRLIESRLMRTVTLQANLRVMFSKLAQVVLLLAAILIALPAVGIDLTLLSVFGGMLGVGIGFGLQKIAANYISGFIILMDRSVSLGDVVTIGEHSGTLTKMTARYVVVRGAGGLEALIPNETIITSAVVNHSYSDRKVQITLKIQVAYATDLDAARDLMVNVAKANPRALQNPAPDALITGFADSGINLELGVWVEDPEKGVARLRSELYAGIWHAFREQGIEIPFPQREVRVLGEIKTTQNHADKQ